MGIMITHQSWYHNTNPRLRHPVKGFHKTPWEPPPISCDSSSLDISTKKALPALRGHRPPARTYLVTHYVNSRKKQSILYYIHQHTDTHRVVEELTGGELR